MDTSDLLGDMKTYILTVTAYTIQTCEYINKCKASGYSTFTDLKSDDVVIFYKFCNLADRLCERFDSGYGRRMRYLQEDGLLVCLRRG